MADEITFLLVLEHHFHFFPWGSAQQKQTE
jgi:hypothetical protein